MANLIKTLFSCMCILCIAFYGIACQEKASYTEIENAEYAANVLYERMHITVPSGSIITQFTEKEYDYFYVQIYVRNEDYSHMTEELQSNMTDVSSSDKSSNSQLKFYEDMRFLCDWWYIKDIDTAIAKYYKCIAGINYGEPKSRYVRAFVFEEPNESGYLVYLAY